MTHNRAAISKDRPKSRKVPIQERAMLMGNIVCVNGYRANLELLKQRFAEGDYQTHETPHFLLFTRSEEPARVLVHWFAPEEIDADLGYWFIQELKPLGILKNEQDFGNIFGGIVFSLSPHRPQLALQLYTENSLRRYQDLLTKKEKYPFADSPVESFAALYRRVCQLISGERVLDAGCSSGFLPLLLAEAIPRLTSIVGVDIRSEPFPLARKIAQERHLDTVQFMQADLLMDDCKALGMFDTVVALHVLEHFREEVMYDVLANLLKITRRRLILAVPYEKGEPEAIYGHKQIFTSDKLEAVGKWCVQQIGGTGRMWVEESKDGLLVIDQIIQAR